VAEGFIETMCGKKYYVSKDGVINITLITTLKARRSFATAFYFFLFVANFVHQRLKCGLCFLNMFHSLQLTYRDAASNCCEYGLALASVETLAEVQCINNGNLGDG
jgi:hypothetical protein